MRTSIGRGGLAVALLLILVAAPSAAEAQVETCNGLAVTVSGDVGTDGDDVMVGTDEGEHIRGEAGNDTICALAGNDWIDGGPGDDFIDGGDGTDGLFYVQTGDEAGPVVVDLLVGQSSGGSGSDSLLPGTLENVLLNCSAPYEDTVYGDEEANTIVAGSGSDTIVGNGGDDVIYGTDPSVGKTDALCWDFQNPDNDSIDGGPGADKLFGNIGNDTLDGGADFDIVDGGSESDACSNGERYARCETEITPAPPPECSDGVDNDGNGSLDYPQDPGCGTAHDPIEVLDPAKACSDGFDNDEDGDRDYPEDLGCESFEDKSESGPCGLPCPPPFLSIDYDPKDKMLHGFFTDDMQPKCVPRRVIVVVRRSSSGTIVMKQTRANDTGIWSVRLGPRRGRFYASMTPRSYETEEGLAKKCKIVDSTAIKLR